MQRLTIVAVAIRFGTDVGPRVREGRSIVRHLVLDLLIVIDVILPV